jgi:Lrp/AsnC family leucine-responsive transcriptional regulator
MGLTKIDSKVLDFICFNGVHLPEAEIAKRLRLKPTTVSYSLKKMRKERVILGYRYRANYSRLGLSTQAWVLLKLSFAEIDSFGLIDKMLEYPQVHVAAFVTGDFDVALKVMERNIFSIDKFVRKLYQEFSDSIEAVDVLVVTKNFKTHNLVTNSQECLKSFDQTDFEILNIRMQHPEKELAEIASELGLHRNTVSKRWKAFWEKGVLVKKTPVINPEYHSMLKISLRAILLIEANSEASAQIAEKMLEMEQVHELNRVLGNYSLLAIVRTENIREFLDFLKWLLSKAAPKGGIKKTLSMMSLSSRPHKPNYLPQLKAEKIISFRKGKLVCPSIPKEWAN